VKTILSPQEYHYLYSPLRADPAEMIKYTIKSLCVSGQLEIFSKLIYINPGEKYKRSRVFLKLGSNYRKENNYSVSDLFILSLFKETEELRFFEIRQQINTLLDEKLSDFKSKYVYKDVKARGLCRFKYFLTRKGRYEKKICANLIDTVDKDIDKLLQNEKLINSYLSDMGANIIFLDEITLTKLKKTLHGIDELNLLFGLDIEDIEGTYSYGGMGGGMGSFGSYSGGGFSGFGGGSFGGGGAGGSW